MNKEAPDKDGEGMRPQLYRVSVIAMIIGLALIGRGIGMGRGTLLWTGVSLVGGNLLFILVSYCHAAANGTHTKTASTDTSG